MIAVEQEQVRRGIHVPALVRRAWPMWLVAFSLNGFFLYLGALDLAGVGPRTATTAAYYGLLAIALLAAVWRRRALLELRLRRPSRLVVAFSGAAGLLVAWHSLNTLLLANGSLAYRLAALLLLWSLPTALAAASLRLDEFRAVAQGLATLALVYVGVGAVAAAQVEDGAMRFSPIAELDFISAALIPALGAVAWFFAWPHAHLAVRLVGATVLVAATVLPGSRGPVVALTATLLVLALVQPRRAAVFLAPLAAGLALGTLLSSQLGTLDYLSGSLPGSLSSSGGAASSDEPISTLSIRRQWFETAVAEAPERPFLGHGVGMLVDDTPEAHRMGVAGQRIYPHNTFAEAAYSLGVVGLVSFLLVIGAAAVALARIVRGRKGDARVALLLGLGVFAFVNTNVSGAIGTDALLWAVAAAAVALYADARGAGTASRERS